MDTSATNASGVMLACRMIKIWRLYTRKSSGWLAIMDGESSRARQALRVPQRDLERSHTDRGSPALQRRRPAADGEAAARARWREVVLEGSVRGPYSHRERRAPHGASDRPSDYYG